MGTEAPKDGAPSKASPVISSWRQSIWFLTISDSRAQPEKILAFFASADAPQSSVYTAALS